MKFWNPFKRKKKSYTNYRSLVTAILDAYRHSWTSKGVDWDYNIQEEKNDSGVLVRIHVGSEGQTPLLLFQTEAASKIIITNDLWRSVFMAITMAGITSIYRAAVQADRDKVITPPSNITDNPITKEEAHEKDS